MISFKHKLSLLFLFLFAHSLLPAQDYAFSGLFHESSTPTRYWNNMDWTNFIAKNKSLREEGYQLIDFEAQHIGIGKSGRFWGIWQKTKVRTRIKSAAGWDAFKQLCLEQRKDKFVLDDVESILNRKGNRIYIGLFSRGKQKQYYHQFRRMDELEKHNRKVEKKNTAILVDVDQFSTKDGKNRYLAIYDHKDKSKGKTRLITAKSFEEFQTQRKSREKSGWQLFDYEEFDYNKKTYYLGVFQQQKAPASLWRKLNWRSLKAHRSHMSRHRGMKLIDLELKRGKGITHTPKTYVGKIKDTPDIWQHIPTRAGKLFNSNSFCGPTAVSNGFMYWAKNGYSKLDPHNSQIEMVKTLGDKHHMNSQDGTNLKSMTYGIRKYLKDHGYGLDHAYMWHIGKPRHEDKLKKMSDVSMKSRLGKIDLKTAHRSIINPKATTLLLWGRYEKDKKGRLERKGGHYVTLVGYGQDENDNLNAKILICHNPSTSNKKSTQEYLEIKPLVGVDGITQSTKIYRTRDKKKTWEDECKDKQLIKKQTRDGKMNYYVLEGILDFRL